MLTYASLAGNVASFLIVAVRDDRQYFAEIKSSLDFGQKCRNVKNNPKEMLDAANLQLQLAHMKEANAGSSTETTHLVPFFSFQLQLAHMKEANAGSSTQATHFSSTHSTHLVAFFFPAGIERSVVSCSPRTWYIT
jgi:hypothetical protein